MTIDTNHVGEQDIHESFVSTVKQPLLEHNYLVILSAHRQCLEHENEEGINMAWMTLDSTTGATIDATEVYIYKDYSLPQALQKVYTIQNC
jgi:hypothetical protein